MKDTRVPAENLPRLKDFFPAEDLEWKPQAVSKKTKKALAVAYITNRAIMDRLDDVCGEAGWRNEFRNGPQGGVLCGISINVGGEWITKWDGAENTDIEPVKGGLSGSMKRAASMWGIGRYLYQMPTQWVPIDERGRFQQAPTVPRAFLPAVPRAQPNRSTGQPNRSPEQAKQTGHAESDAVYQPTESGGTPTSNKITRPQHKMIEALGSSMFGAAWRSETDVHGQNAKERGVRAVSQGRTTSLTDITKDEASALIDLLQPQTAGANE